MGSARQVGRVVSLTRFPVKSMAAEALESVDVGWQGLTGDRRWAFIRPGLARTGFPWQTIREKAQMWHYRPTFTDPAKPNSSPVRVRTPAGAEYDVDDPQLAADLGPGVTVVKTDRGLFDDLPLSLITTQSVTELGTRVGAVLDPLRFRPNLLVEATSGGPFQEDDWVGATLRIGEARMRVDKRDQRCVMINVDPSAGRRDHAVLHALGAERQACAGVCGSTVSPGRVALGDAVYVED